MGGEVGLGQRGPIFFCVNTEVLRIDLHNGSASFASDIANSVKIHQRTLTSGQVLCETHVPFWEHGLDPLSNIPEFESSTAGQSQGWT